MKVFINSKMYVTYFNFRKVTCSILLDEYKFIQNISKFRGQDLNLRPLENESNELPSCSTSVK